MLENSKLSNRFKKSEKKELKIPAKLSFGQKKTTQEQDKTEFVEQNIQENENFIPKDTIKDELITKIESIPVWGEYSEDKQKELIKSFVESKLAIGDLNFSEDEKTDFIESLYSLVIGFGPLEYLIAQENVSAIFVNGVNGVHIEIGGRILNTEMTLSDEQLNLILSYISMVTENKINNSKSVWNVKFNDLLISIITKDISISGVNIVIRKTQNIDLDYILDNSFVSKEVLDFVINAISEKKNIILSGDINVGKTSLLGALINAVISDKRTAFLSKDNQFEINSKSVMQFKINKALNDFEDIVESVLKLEPEYIVSDLNECVPEFSERNGYIATLRANSVDAAISKLLKSYIVKDCMPEKLAKTTVLTNYDYIIQINKSDDGKRCITSIVELSPARTAALSVKTVSKLEKGHYINEFPQPLTSIRAEALFSQSGSMSSRFYQKK